VHKTSEKLEFRTFLNLNIFQKRVEQMFVQFIHFFYEKNNITSIYYIKYNCIKNNICLLGITSLAKVKVYRCRKLIRKTSQNREVNSGQQRASEVNIKPFKKVGGGFDIGSSLERVEFFPRT